MTDPAVTTVEGVSPWPDTESPSAQLRRTQSLLTAAHRHRDGLRAELARLRDERDMWQRRAITLQQLHERDEIERDQVWEQINVLTAERDRLAAELKQQQQRHREVLHEKSQLQQRLIEQGLHARPTTL